VLPSRRPRRWPHRLLVGTIIFLAVCIVAAASGYAYLRWQFSKVATVPFTPGILRNDGNDDPGQPMNVLLVGSDTRATISPAEAKEFGSSSLVTGQRSDTIMVLHIDPGPGKASILSIPRDLYVPIAGTTRTDRINSSFEKGPAQLIQTIRQALGIEIDHYMEVDFVGFRGIVDAIGGVNVYFPAPARDRFSGLNVTAAGCVSLSGNMALSYVRSRHYEYFESGRWRSDPTSDFGRIQRQQDFIRRVMRKAISRGVRNPITMNSLINSGVKDLTIDDKLSSSDIFRLGKRFRSLEPDAVDMLTVPTVPTTIGGADVLKLQQPAATQVIERFNHPNGTAQQAAPTSVLPSSVRIRVLNGTGKGKQATDVASALHGVGFNVAGTGDADSFRYATTTIRYGTGQLAKAQLVAASISATPTLVLDTTLRDVDVVVITGQSYAGVHAPGQSPTTTAPTSTTTEPPATASKGAPPQPQC
jgi:LCP family protein required for cell wall assembly